MTQSISVTGWKLGTADFFLRIIIVLREATPSSMAASRFNLFPDNKNLILSKLKAFADNKINVT